MAENLLRPCPKPDSSRAGLGFAPSMWVFHEARMTGLEIRKTRMGILLALSRPDCSNLVWPRIRGQIGAIRCSFWRSTACALLFSFAALSWDWISTYFSCTDFRSALRAASKSAPRAAVEVPMSLFNFFSAFASNFCFSLCEILSSVDK